MQISSSFVAFCMASVAFATPGLLVVNTEPQHGPGTKCPPDWKSGSFLRAYNPMVSDHFYTTDPVEMRNHITGLGYEQEATPGRIFYTQVEGSVPLYRAYNPAIADHFYTTDNVEMMRAVSHLGYHAEGISGFVYPYRYCGAIPLYRAYSNGATDHFYTSDEDEWRNAVDRLGYTAEGITGYVLPV